MPYLLPFVMSSGIQGAVGKMGPRTFGHRLQLSATTYLGGNVLPPKEENETQRITFIFLL